MYPGFLIWYNRGTIPTDGAVVSKHESSSHNLKECDLRAGEFRDILNKHFCSIQPFVHRFAIAVPKSLKIANIPKSTKTSKIKISETAKI